MSGYAFTPLAKADIFDIWSYIAEENEDAALSVDKQSTTLAPFLPMDHYYVVIQGPISQAGPSVSGRSPAIPTTPSFTGPKPPRFRLSPSCMGKEISDAFLRGARKCH